MTPKTASALAVVSDSQEQITPRDQHHSVTFVTPEEDPHFVVADDTKAFLRAVARLAKGRDDKPGRQVNVGIRGPKGAGKTSLAEWFARITGRPLFIVDVPTLREPKDILGYRDAVQDPATGAIKLEFIPSGFLRAIQTPNAVILLDEGTRVHASVLNILLPLLDHRRRVYVDELQTTIRVAEGVVFFLTANIGIQYSGTWQMDAALEDRLQYQLDIGYLDEEREAQVLVNKTGIKPEVAKRLAEVAKIIRDRVRSPDQPLSHEVSTRQLIEAGHLIHEGVTALDAAQFTFVPTYSDEGGTQSERAAVLTILQGKLTS